VNGTLVGITAHASDADATHNGITYSLLDDAGGRFTIDSTSGVVSVADGSLLDRETAASHGIVVRATSADGSISTQGFVINIGDVDEFDTGAIDDTDSRANAVPENAANGSTVGITAFAADGDLTHSSITYTLDDNAGGRFAIDAATGMVTVADGSLLDHESAAAHAIVVRATSADGSFSTRSFVIGGPENEHAPVIGGDHTLRVDENTTAVTTIVATDADRPSQSLRYSIVGGADAAHFRIDAATGELRFVSAANNEAPTDAGHDNVYDLIVQASDGSRVATQAVAVQVGNVNEAPTGMGSEGGVVRATAHAGATVATVTAIDPDRGDAFRFTLLQDANGRFVIDETSGRIMLAGSGRFDTGHATTHQLVVRITDEAGMSIERKLTVTVMPADDNPVPLPTPLPEPEPAPAPAPSPVPEPGSVKPGHGLPYNNLPLDPPPPGAGEPPSDAGTGMGIEPATDTGRRHVGVAARLPGRATDGELALPGVSFALESAEQAGEDGALSDTLFGNLARLLAGLRGGSVQAEVDAPIDSLEDQARRSFDQVLSDPITVASTTFTAGFIWWLTRGGGLLTTALTAVPAWRHVDLLPVLAHPAEDEEEEEDDTLAAQHAADDSVVADLFEGTAARSPFRSSR
jgi:Cadherin domain